MKCILKNEIDENKPIALIGFSLKQVSEMLQKNNLQHLILPAYWENWDFSKDELCSFQASNRQQVFLYLTEKDFDTKLYIKAIMSILKRSNQYQIKELQILFDTTDKADQPLSIAAKEIMLTDYAFDKYKKKKSNSFLQTVYLVTQHASKKALAIMEEAENLAAAVKITRDMVNEPSNVMYPQTLAEQAIALGQEAGFSTTVLAEKEIEELQMHAFLNVAKGSQKPPRLIVLKYQGNPEKPDEIFGLVGKGLTYDSGGYSIKTTEGMFYMKADMAGAASVIGVMYAVAKQKLRCNVTAVIAACENLISGNAYKPGEVIRSMSGKTIEIGNTDAEGRLTLIDAICYAVQEQKVTKIVDVATLTGAVVVGLGNIRTGVISNNDSFFADLEEASNLSGERFWRLPHDEEYRELLKSEVADISNSGGRMAGTITAGLFLKYCLPHSIPWMHFDIAGTAFLPKKIAAQPYGATGVPVSTLYYLLKKKQN